MHARVVCLCHARVRTVVLRALSVCTVVYVVPFSRVGLARVGVHTPPHHLPLFHGPSGEEGY